MSQSTSPDLIVIATGGIAQNPPLEAGDNLVVSSWDIIAGTIKLESPVFLYDDNGSHSGMSGTELIAATGACSSTQSAADTAPLH